LFGLNTGTTNHGFFFVVCCSISTARWQEVAPFNEPAPECLGGIQSRDNHNGNVRNGGSAFRMGAPKAWVKVCEIHEMQEG
jgi:hypothetical protein